MNNENVELSAAELESLKKLRAEKLRYQPNTFSYWFGMLSVLLNAIFIFVSFNQLNVYSMGQSNGVEGQYAIFFIIIANILLILASFLGAEKVKAYNEKWSIVMIVFGIISLARIFFIPILVISGSSFLVGKVDPFSWRLIMGIVLIVILGLMALCYFTSGIIAYKKTKTLQKFMESIDENVK